MVRGLEKIDNTMMRRTYRYGGATQGPGDPEKEPVTMETFAADADKMQSILNRMGSMDQFFDATAGKVAKELGGVRPLTSEKYLQGVPSRNMPKTFYDQFDLLADFIMKIDESGVKELPDWEGSNQQQIYEAVDQFAKELWPYANVYNNPREK